RNFTLTQAGENRLLAELQSPVEFGREVRITLKKGAVSSGGSRGTAEDRSVSFRTPGPFVLKSHERLAGYGRYGNLVEIEFSYPLNESTAAAAISTEPEMPLGPENFEFWGSTLRVCNLPAAYGEKFKIRVSGALEDVYGRRLEKPAVLDITMPGEPPPVGSARFLGYGHAMLEAQFPPRLLFEYTNIAPGSNYILRTTNHIWGTPSINPDTVLPYIALDPGKPNVRYFEEIELAPYLNTAKRGFVTFLAELKLLTGKKTRGDETRTQTNRLNIQVTDLGLTVRYGFNKTVVLVTKLSTGEPVENASVKLYAPWDVETTFESDIDSLDSFGSAFTGRDGLAVINTPAGLLREKTFPSREGGSLPYILAEKDGDRAIFNPSSHNNWAFDVVSRSPRTAEEISAATFMFSDRGLYKPGETLTFRGVDRSQILGMYSIYQGDYTVALEEDRYNGETVASLSGTASESGGFYGSLSVPGDAAPGAYRLVYRRNDPREDSRSANRNRISANVPVTVAFFERLKFQASLSAPPSEPVSGSDINLSLRASYLSGGSLSGASWEGDWYKEAGGFNPRTRETSGYVFGPRRAYDGKRRIASEKGALSGEGTAGLAQKTGDGSDIQGAPYLYSAEVRVTDLSNQMVAAYRSVLVHPARFYIGLSRSGDRGFARAGQELSFGFITVTPSGEKAAPGLFLQSGEDAGMMTVELVREEWRRVQQRGVNGYIYDQYVMEQVSEGVQKIRLRDGAVKATPPIVGFYTLRASALDRDGKTALTELSFYATGSGGGWWNMNSADELRLTPDQDVYNPGDTARILLQSPLPAGRYLITVEREGIFTEEVRTFTEAAQVIDVPIARNFVPVVYVSVSSYSVRSGPPVHQYGSPDLDKPKGYFGVTKLMVNPRTRAFSVKVESDKKTYRPGDEVTMTLIAERGGRPLPNAELTLMAVDRGVLDLVNYHVPDPIAYFYNPDRFPLAVSGGDSRAWLMDPVTYSVKNLAGGDGGESKIEERKDFNPTAVFEPMLLTDSGGKARCTFKLPDNLTTYRVTVFGVQGDLFALKESEIAAQNRINVREVLPRRLRERDTAETGVLITNLDSASHKISVSLELTEVEEPADAATGRRRQKGEAFVDGRTEQQITLKSGENGVVYFDVAAVKEGSVNLNFTINSDILNERLVHELIIEHPYVRETVTSTGEVGGDSPSGTEALVIPSFADNNAGSFSISLDATRLGLLESAVQYLFHYPYGCMEQRSAAVFPLVVFGEYLDSLNLQSEVSDPAKVVENELRDWARVQLPGGGFPYWPSGTRADFYVSLRIAHILAAARAKGIPVPASIRIGDLAAYLDRAYQETRKWSQGHSDYYYQSYLQAYMLYVFALLGEPVDPSRLAEILGRDNADPSALAFAGMSYRLLDRPSEAASAAARLRNLVRLTARGADISDPVEGRRGSFYGGRIEQLALALEFFVQQYPGDQINGRLLYSLLENKRAAGFWESTAVTVRVLSAIDAMIRAEDLESLDLGASASLGGNKLLEGNFRGLGARPVSASFAFTGPVLSALEKDRMQPLVINRRGRGSVYYSASLSYAIPAELQGFRDEGLGVFLSIHDVNTDEEIKGSALVSGKTYRARVRVSGSRDRTYMALRVPVPSGAEILDSAFVTAASYAETGREEDPVRGNSRVSHRIILDNEIQYFWDNFNKGESTVDFIFRAVRRGVYPTPPVQAECMYESEIFGRSRGLIYTIE
ncbi:MAG: alpha-2-macroglobulin, partial [Spirochaetaceae bacterium]|nr:alpha-2-macroglobulin [Spirochaetaceae bacterium]